jgi:hypothetical protein
MSRARQTPSSIHPDCTAWAALGKGDFPCPACLVRKHVKIWITRRKNPTSTSYTLRWPEFGEDPYPWLGSHRSDTPDVETGRPLARPAAAWYPEGDPWEKGT